MRVVSAPYFQSQEFSVGRPTRPTSQFTVKGQLSLFAAHRWYRCHIDDSVLGKVESHLTGVWRHPRILHVLDFKKHFLITTSRCDRPKPSSAPAVRQERQLLAVRKPTRTSAAFSSDLGKISTIGIRDPEVRSGSSSLCRECDL